MKRKDEEPEGGQGGGSVEKKCVNEC